MKLLLPRLLPSLASLALAASLCAAQTDPAAPPAARGGADPSDDAFRMGSPPALPQGLTEQVMWPAASAEQWKQPCLIRWQRSFDDALRVARGEHRPVLVAVNMDGEIASEHWAGVRYRDPATAALMSRYACVVASVYRHTPRDHDETGQRIACPRFGTVTCGEHIEAERELYEKYFDGRRVAPRHLVVDLEGKEVYDVYFAWDTATIVTTFRKGVEGWPEPVQPPELSLLDRTQSPDVSDREAIETAYAAGDRETRRALLLKLADDHVVDQVELLRQAVFGLDLELARLGRRALASCDTDGALDVIAAALNVPLEDSERRMLLDAVDRLRATLPRARTLAAMHGGLALESRFIDAGALAREYEESAARGVDVIAREEGALARPADGAAHLALAEALLERAEETPEDRFTALLIDDARRALEAALGLGVEGARVEAVQALLADEDDDADAAQEHALRAIEGGLLGETKAGALADASSALGVLSRSRVLRLFAHARQRAIRMAFRAGRDWPPEWLSDVNAAYATVAQGPLEDEMALVEHHDFLRWMGASARAREVLDAALERYPDSAQLHERLRWQLLFEGGPGALEREYEARLARAGAEAPTQLAWFAGYASLVAAEHHRRQNEFEAAQASYERSVGLYGTSAERFPEDRDTCLHYQALARAGIARLLLERGDLAGAAREIVAALALRPDSAASADGLGITPVATSRMLLARLQDAGDAEGAALVQGALDALDPSLLEPPPSELPAQAGRERPRGAPSGPRPGG